MYEKPLPEYLNIMQLCELWSFDQSQLQYAIDKYNIRLCFSIKQKKSRINNTPIIVREVKTNTIESDYDFPSLRKLSNAQMRAEGFEFTKMDADDSFLVTNGSAKFYIMGRGKNRRISLPNMNDYAVDVEHDGFVELSDESFLNAKNGINDLFNNNSELYILKVKSEKKGYTRFLSPACFVKLEDIYIPQDEVRRVSVLITGNSSNMLPYIRQANRLKRADQVTALFNKICVENPIRIDITKVQSDIQLINLAWILAFCRRGCGSFRDVNFDDMALNSMAEDIRKILIGKLQDYGNIPGLTAKYYDEVDLVTGATVTKTLSYCLPPDLIIKLIKEDSIFSEYLLKNELPLKSVSKKSDTKKVLKGTRKVENGEQRPSQQGSARSEIIRSELELILDESCPSLINRDTLWQALLNRAENNQASLFEKNKNKVIEKDTGVVWEREKANHHLDQIIAWHNSK